MIYRPENVLLLGVGVYIAVLILSPLEVLVPIETGSFVYIGLTITALVLGSRFADLIRLRAGARHILDLKLKRDENRLFWAMIWLGGIGNLLKLLDKYVVRGVGSLTGFEAREVLLNSGSGMLSMVAGGLYPFGYLPIFILLGAKVLPRKRWKLMLACIIFLIPALDALLLFSRSFMLVNLAMIYFAVSLTMFQGRIAPLKLILPVLASVMLVLTISIWIFLQRLDGMSLALSSSIYLSGYAHTVAPNDAGQELINRGSLLVGLLPIAQYYIHSILEFQVLWSMTETQNFSWGRLLFAPYFKILTILGVASDPDLFELFPRVGVFTSFWGPFWVDFGWFGPMVMFFLGIIMRIVARAARNGEMRAYPLYTYFCVVLFFMPVVNFAITAQGMYVINAFVLFWFLAPKYSRSWTIR